MKTQSQFIFMSQREIRKKMTQRSGFCPAVLFCWPTTSGRDCWVDVVFLDSINPTQIARRFLSLTFAAILGGRDWRGVSWGCLTSSQNAVIEPVEMTFATIDGGFDKLNHHFATFGTAPMRVTEPRKARRRKAAAARIQNPFTVH